MRTRRLLRAAWFAAILLLAVLAFRAFIGDIYHVSSPSMEPTIRTGEWVFVRFDRSPPERGEVVVFERAGELVVKRAMGLGPESISIDAFGDLFVNGEPPRIAPGRRPRIPIFDSRGQSLEEQFSMGSTRGNPWTRSERGWELDAREIPRGDQLGLMSYKAQIRDGFQTLDGDERPGTTCVGDLILECELEVLEFGGRLRLALLESGDLFTFSLELGEECGLASLEQRFGNESLTLAQQSWEPDGWLRSGPDGGSEPIRVRFANIDNELAVQVLDAGGEQRQELRVRYPGNHFNPNDHAETGISFGYRAMLGGEQCRLRVTQVRVWRDLHYTQRGEFGVDKRLALGEQELFLLGDNSAHSRDSREWGPIDRSQIIGRALFVVWPPARWRRIDAQ